MSFLIGIPALFVVIAVAVAIGGPGGEDRYLHAAKKASTAAGFVWDDDSEAAALKFGNDMCAEFDKYPDNTREQNVLGTQASVRLSLPDDKDKAQVLAEYVPLASQYLCPED